MFYGGQFAVAAWLILISASSLLAYPYRYNHTGPLFNGTAYEQIYWQPDKVDITGIDGFDAMLAEAFARFNDTTLCTTPYPQGPDLEEFSSDEHFRLYLEWENQESYFYSSIIHCRESYSVRLFNFRIPQVPLYDGRLDVRIFCRHALENAQKSVDIMKKEQGLTSLGDDTYTGAHVLNFDERVEGRTRLEWKDYNYMLCGATLWTEDLSWGVIVGYETLGCPKAADDYVILTDSSWAEGF
ncbi:hypothetical protein ABW19_dt0201407 [Dactylella cylindrospora]|nr:hypothetical protein ABW19_dt0201407 [Dactylella cylindrospora]